MYLFYGKLALAAMARAALRLRHATSAWAPAALPGKTSAAMLGVMVRLGPARPATPPTHFFSRDL